jgi:hypothetical protein
MPPNMGGKKDGKEEPKKKKFEAKPLTRYVTLTMLTTGLTFPRL